MILWLLSLLFLESLKRCDQYDTFDTCDILRPRDHFSTGGSLTNDGSFMSDLTIWLIWRTFGIFGRLFLYKFPSLKLKISLNSCIKSPKSGKH